MPVVYKKYYQYESLWHMLLQALFFTFRGNAATIMVKNVTAGGNRDGKNGDQKFCSGGAQVPNHTDRSPVTGALEGAGYAGK